MNKSASKSNLFKKAVAATPDIAAGFMAGLNALGKKSRFLDLAKRTECSGSVDIDAVLQRQYPSSNRWDYAFCYKGEAYFIEVHSAETGEVITVLRKLQWLKDWLVSQAPEINRLKSKSQPPYCWIQSGRYNIQKNSPQFRQAVQAGIKPVPRLSLS